MALTRAQMMEAIHKAYNLGSPNVAAKIYAASDGYGIKGYIPPQGMDWSGIRDSTDAAVAEMYQIAAQKAPKRIEYAGPNGVEVLKLKSFDNQGCPVYSSLQGDLVVVRKPDGMLVEQ